MDLLASLRSLGLTTYQASCYVALVGMRHASASDVAAAANVPRSRVYEVLATLQDRGWVARREGRPVIYQAIDPDVCMVQARRRLIAAVDDAKAELQRRFVADDAVYGGPIWLLAERTLLDHVQDACRASRSRILVVLGFPMPALDALLPAWLQRASKRGVRVDVIAPHRPEGFEAFAFKAAQIPVRYVVADQRHVFISMRVGQTTRSLWNPSSKLVESLSMGLYGLLDDPPDGPYMSVAGQQGRRLRTNRPP